MDNLPEGIKIDPKAWESVADQNNKMEALYLALHGLDWAQTREIAANPDKYHERNPILGKHPSQAEVNRYFMLTGLGHYALSKMLPPEWAKPFQQGTIGLEGYVTGRNKFGIGIGTKF